MIPEKYKQYIPYLLLICVIGISLSLYFNRTNELLKEVQAKTISAANSNILAKEAVKQSEISKKEADKSNKSRDSIKLILEKERKGFTIIKKQYYEKIKIINAYSVSDMQSFFDNRYGTEKSGYSGFDTIKKSN